MSTNNDWIKMSERKPTEEDLPIIMGAYNTGNGWTQLYCGNLICTGQGWTHWFKSAKVPAPPPRARTQREEDYSAAHNYCTGLAGENTLVNPEAAFLAGIAYRDAQNAKDLRLCSGSSMGSTEQIVQSYTNLRRRCGLDK